MTAPPSLKAQQFSFAIAGVIFGFVLGFVAAHQFYGGRFGGVAPAVAPETMGGARPGMAAAPSGGMPPAAGGGMEGGGMPGGGASQQEMMDQVTRELAALKQAIEQNPRDMVALTRLGNLYMDAQMLDRAVEFYNRALAIEPANVDVRTDMGSCLRQLGKPQEALKAFEESIALDPSHWKSWFNIGVVSMYDLGEFEKAESAFRKVLELNPGSFDMDAVRAEIQKLKSQKAGPGQGAPS